MKNICSDLAGVIYPTNILIEDLTETETQIQISQMASNSDVRSVLVAITEFLL